MKRYMVIEESFDTTPNFLNIEIKETWAEEVKDQWRTNQAKMLLLLKSNFGQGNFETKLHNYRDIGAEPISVVSYHNKFFRQCTHAFITQQYYPALTGVCSLAERILNHLVIRLRGYHKASKSYKYVYDKDSFDNWDIPIKVLEEWGIFLPDVVDKFKALRNIRNGAVHFNEELEIDARTPALEAIHLLKSIIGDQFGSRFGKSKTWLVENAPGFSYLKKDAAELPFIKEFYIPACILVGPFRDVTFNGTGWEIRDDYPYENRDISDEEFVNLLSEHLKTEKETAP